MYNHQGKLFFQIARLRLEEQTLRASSTISLRDFVLLETKAQLTRYDVFVKTGGISRSCGTDANVYLILFGENDNSGKM